MTKWLPTGEFNKRIIIERPTDGTATAYNDKPKTYSTLATVWARIKPLTAREQLFAEQVKAETDYVVTIRYMSGLLKTDRVNYNGQLLEIHGIINIEMRNRELQLLCSEVI